MNNLVVEEIYLIFLVVNMLIEGELPSLKRGAYVAHARVSFSRPFGLFVEGRPFVFSGHLA